MNNDLSVEEISIRLADRAESIAGNLLPGGRLYKGEWVCGDITGAPGESLKVSIAGVHSGKWMDWATGQKGDLLDLYQLKTGSTKAEAVSWAKQILHINDDPRELRDRPLPKAVVKAVPPIPWIDRTIEAMDYTEAIAAARGYSVEFVEALRAGQHIGTVNGQVAFPVSVGGSVVSAHIKMPTPPDERQRWEFQPRLKDIGVSLSPYIIGDLASARRVEVYESQWDGLAAMERRGWHEGRLEGIAIVCTRGTSCALPEEGFPKGVPVYAFPQNDPAKEDGKPTPAEGWMERLKACVVANPFHIVRTPSQYKDLNDWTRAGATDQEIRQAVKSAERVRKSKLSFRTISELMAMVFDDSDNYFGDRIIAAGQACTLTGPGGIGKTRMVIQLALSMIIGRQFLDMDTHAKGKKWLFLQTENSNRRLRADVIKMLAGLKLSVDEVAAVEELFVIHTLEGELDTYLDVEDPASLAQIEGAIDDHEPDVVVFDPLNTFTSLDLNKDQDMKQVTRCLTAAVMKGNPERALIVVHHSLTGKAGAARSVGWDASSFSRNSKALYNWTRAQINVAPRDPEDNNLLVFACGKNNNGKPFAPMGVVFVEPRGIYCQDPDFNLDEFKDAVGLESAKPKTIAISPDRIGALFDGTITKSELVRRIIQEFGCQKTRAYDAVEAAAKSGVIVRKRGKNYNSEFTKPNPQSAFMGDGE